MSEPSNAATVETVIEAQLNFMPKKVIMKEPIVFTEAQHDDDVRKHLTVFNAKTIGISLGGIKGSRPYEMSIIKRLLMIKIASPEKLLNVGVFSFGLLLRRWRVRIYRKFLMSRLG